jgi:hypothetical protein
MIRRNFLKILAASIIMPLPILMFREDILIGVLKRRLPKGVFNEGDYSIFSKDFMQRLVDNGNYGAYKNKLNFLSIFSLFYYYGVFNVFHSKTLRFEEYVVTKFVLSTNFYTSKKHNGKSSYVGLYDPKVQACSNPFTRR